jgi:hypothetical protein
LDVELGVVEYSCFSKEGGVLLIAQKEKFFYISTTHMNAIKK